jgi:hypothetical protein
MTQVTLNIEDDKLQTFIAFIKTLSYVSVDKKEDFVIPKWQQDLVMNRIKNAKPENYSSIDNLDNEIRLQK